MNRTPKKTGRLAERYVLFRLRLSGYKKAAVNYTVRGGEIDLVVYDKDHLVFVEVKARKPGAMYGGAEAVGAEKQKRIIYASKLFLASCGKKLRALQPRYDVVTVRVGGFGFSIEEHIKGAFDAA